MQEVQNAISANNNATLPDNSQYFSLASLKLVALNSVPDQQFIFYIPFKLEIFFCSLNLLFTDLVHLPHVVLFPCTINQTITVPTAHYFEKSDELFMSCSKIGILLFIVRMSFLLCVMSCFV